MKKPYQYISAIRIACVSEDSRVLSELIELIQKDAIMLAFQNTTEIFNMEAIQGCDGMTNDIIYELLIKE